MENTTTERGWSKGPWAVRMSPLGDGNCIVQAPRPDRAYGQEILGSDDTDYPTKVADAHLCAAAPELYEALVAAQEHLDYCGYGDSWKRECAKESKLEEKINAALRAAEGRR